MADNGNSSSPRRNPGSRTIQIELAMFEKIDQRLDNLAEDVRDVRERVIRIESQEVSAKLVIVEARVRALEEWKARVAGQIALIVVPIAAVVSVIIKLVIDLAAK